MNLRGNLPVKNFAGLGDDNEPLTEEDWAAIREGKEAIRRGEFVSLAELEKELGLLAKNIEEVTHGG